MALIVFLALALARPSIKTAGALGSVEAPVAALVFDTSKRMEYRHQNRTRLEVAQEMEQSAPGTTAAGKPGGRAQHAPSRPPFRSISGRPSTACSGWSRWPIPSR